jgi:hypothetical protein
MALVQCPLFPNWFRGPSRHHLPERRSGCGLLAMLLLATGLGIPAPETASARASGIHGYSGNPLTNDGEVCSYCHRDGVVPSVMLSGPTSVDAGTTSTYTLTISGGQAAACGLGVSTTSGKLTSIGLDTKLRLGELVQADPKLVDSMGTCSFSFD